MINTPPAPSVESLALAHLQDNPLEPTSLPSPRPSHKAQGTVHTLTVSYKYICGCNKIVLLKTMTASNICSISECHPMSINLYTNPLPV